MLDRCEAVAKRAGLDPAKFDLKAFRSTYATRMLRQGFDVRTVQYWMGHKSPGPHDLVQVQGYSPTEAGAALLPLILLMFCCPVGPADCSIATAPGLRWL
jgi:integrase